MRSPASRLALLALVTLAGPAAGCFGGAHSSPGPSYFYQECGPGCPVELSAMASGGAVAHIDVSTVVAAARSRQPEVADVSLTGGVLEVRSGLPGHADIDLVDHAGNSFGTAPITVVATAKLGFAVASTHDGIVEVLEGSSQRFQVTPQDVRGRPTVGWGSIAFSLEGPLATLSDPVDGDAVPFAGTAPGRAIVTASTSSASPYSDPVVTTLSVDVVDPLQLIALDAVVRTGDPDLPEDVVVDVTARTAFGPVYGAACSWSTDPSVYLGQQAVATFAAPAQSSTHFRLGMPGHFIARCAIGNVTTSVTLRR
jgi:hypothetical protein